MMIKARENFVGTFNTTRRRLIAAGALAGMTAAMPAVAELKVSIMGVGENQFPITVNAFETAGNPPVTMSEVISADLERSGAFRMVAVAQSVDKAHLAKPEQLNVWAQGGSNALVLGSIEPTDEGGWAVAYYLHDTVSGQLLDTQSYTVPTGALRFTAHRIADRIYKHLTGEGAFFASQLCYVSQLGRHKYQLIVTESDGHNPRVALESPEPIISPTWSPDGSTLAYVSFERQKPIVYVQNLSTGQRRAIAAFQGNNSAPAFSPDGRKLAVALSRDGLTQIYTMNRNGTDLQRFTQSYGIDTEPVFSKDGQYIYFTSDRGGSPQIYRQKLNSRRAERVTFGSNYAISPDISPNGELLTYISRVGRKFRTAVMNLRTGESILVTATERDESPSFAPNGRFVVYATEVDGRGVLGIASVDGRLSTRLTGDGDIREPSWGPILQ